MTTVSLKSKPKRKRSIVVDDTRISVIADSKRTKKDVEVSPFQYDNDEVDQCDAQKHLEQFQEASSSVANVTQRVHELKSSLKPGQSTSEEIEKLRTEGILKFIMLKKLNRVSHIRCKKVRDATTQAKEKMDACHLQLQNLLYEATHLQKEITKCLLFKSKDEEIELVPIEDFIKDAPPEISKIDEPNNDEHQLKLARLDWELEQRKSLSAKLKEVEKERDSVEEEIRKKRDQLEGLEPKLSQILETTKPVQEYLDLPFDKIREDHEKASFLPPPLYVLYMQTSAYQEACDNLLTVTIEGDIDVAKAFKNVVSVEEDESDSDQDDQEGEKKSSKRRRKTVEAKLTSVKDRVFAKHPLYITLAIQCKDGSNITLTFHYLVQLKVTVVKVAIQPGPQHKSESAFSSDLLSPDTILFDLYPGDHGNSIPNPSSHYELARLSLSDDSGDYTSAMGRPYMWVQWLCGVQFLSETPGQEAQSCTSARHMQETIRRLRRRLQSRLSLLKQLVSLEQKNITVEQAGQAMFPTKITTKLTSWTKSTFSDFQALSHTRQYCDIGLATENHMYYTAKAERKSAKLVCDVVIPADYPVSPPVFVVCITWKNILTACNDFSIRDMESELNIHWDELIKCAAAASRDQLLTNQLQRLLMCADVYLETEDLIGGDKAVGEMSRSHIYPKLTRGPHRSKPYKYEPNLGFFTQRS